MPSRGGRGIRGGAALVVIVGSRRVQLGTALVTKPDPARTRQEYPTVDYQHWASTISLRYDLEIHRSRSDRLPTPRQHLLRKLGIGQGAGAVGRIDDQGRVVVLIISDERAPGNHRREGPLRISRAQIDRSI